MSNNTYGSGYQQPANMSNPVPPRHDKVDRFFAWIRGSGLMRGNNRWIAGVCDGIAVRYGLSPVFVRAVVAASTLVCGFGAAFYAAAWVLLPDCRDNRISGEELVYGHWQWSLLGPIILMIIAFCFPGIGVLLAIIAVAVLLIMVNSLANKAQQQRGAAYANNPQQGQYQDQYHGQAQQPQGQYQSGPMPYGPSGNANPTFYGSANSAPYAPQSWQQTQKNTQAETQATQGNNEATFREQDGMNPGSGVEDADTNTRQAGSRLEEDGLNDRIDNRGSSLESNGPDSRINNPDSSNTETGQNRFDDGNQAYSADTQTSQNGVWNGRQNASDFNGRQPSGQSWTSPFAAGASSSAAVPPTYMAEPARPYQQSSAQSAARPWGPRRARRKPAGFVVVLLALGASLLSGALVAIQCFGNGGYMGTILQYGTYWIGGILIFLGVVIAVLGLAGHRAGGLHPLVWIAAFVAVVFIVSDIGYSLVVTGLAQTSVTYTQVNVSGFKAIDGSNDQQLKKLKKGTAINGHRLDDDAVNIDLSDYSKTHGTHDVTLRDGSTVKSGCPTGTINLTDSKATVFVTLPAGCSYRLSHGNNANMQVEAQKLREDSRTSKPDTPAKPDTPEKSDASSKSDNSSKPGRFSYSGGCSESDGCGVNVDGYIGDDDSDYYGGANDGSWGYKFCLGSCDGNLVMGSWLGDDPATGTKSLGSGYVAIGRGSQIGIGGNSYDRLEFQHGIGTSKNYAWFFADNHGKMPKTGPELTIDAPYVVEGRVTVQYPDESTVPSYAQFAKGKTEATWRR
ncbi:PspC domain-containing protein [Bifidobacterium sp. ESL0728]|uniref:PspC domain-containing protein n=1 Tax=Bifidobacterium sp. ESL0728 TaxID=2983220 RepID=UPI0023F62DB3|nr:PspC domain-containing protein [Bifidobacterium sp. ESL0728]WEV59488.1 PspC domain-containing protein [Bifidobacterium sp. ESL0728]